MGRDLFARKDGNGTEVYYLPSRARIEVSVEHARSVEAHLFQPVGDDQEPLLVVPCSSTEPGTWVVDLELPSDDLFHLEILAELSPGTPDQSGNEYLSRSGKRWRFLSGTLVARTLSPASETTPAAQDDATTQIQKLEARIQELEALLAQEHRPVNLVNPRCPPAVGREPGWEYHKSLSADLDSDGQEETVSVTTNPVWIPEKKEFGWDDVHPWHIYVEESDGSRTYLFSDWVQLGQLDVILDREDPGVFIVSSRGGGLVVYRATYKGPGQVGAAVILNIPLSNFATWADPMMFAK